MLKQFPTQGVHYKFNRKLLGQNLEPEYFDENFWVSSSRVLGFANGRGRTWFLKSKDLFGVNSALRHYFRGGLIGKVNKDKYFDFKTNSYRSFAEYELLKKLYNAGIPVPRPIGARVNKSKLGYRADILLELIDNSQDLIGYLTKQTLTDEYWYQIGELICKLHSMQVNHTDLNAKNILLQKDNINPEKLKLWLIDFDKCHEQNGHSWKEKNLNRLLRSFEKERNKQGIHFNKKNWQSLLQGYFS